MWRENGNHDRPTRKVRYATNPRNSYGYLLSRMLMRHFEGHPIVRVHAPLSDVSYAQVFDQTIRMMHGHQIGYQGGVGGITIPLKKWLMRQEKGRRADLTLLGHFHTYTNGPGFLVNGSNKGYDTFALNKGYEYEPPKQAFCLIDRDKGKRNASAILTGPDMSQRAA